MGSAYTPGLKVSPHTTIEKTRRLPLKGDVLVHEGDPVTPSTIVARTELPGLMQTVKVSEQLGVEPEQMQRSLQVQVGDAIEKGQILAISKGLFGMFRTEVKSPVSGTLELISGTTGHLGIRQPPTPVEKDAYIYGKVKRVIPEEGVIVECEGALLQGIFGVGGERQGVIAMVADGPDDVLDAPQIKPEHQGKIVVGGSRITLGGLRRAAETGVLGIVSGGVVDLDLIQYLRDAMGDPAFDIGVAITGQEPISFTVVVTEGFGQIRMAERTFSLLRSLEGKLASINGATQIRAGVIRPEVIVSLESGQGRDALAGESGELKSGTPIRIIREPYFGMLGSVAELPPELQQVESETWVRVLSAKLEDGRTVTVPRANVEIIETS